MKKICVLMLALLIAPFVCFFSAGAEEPQKSEADKIILSFDGEEDGAILTNAVLKDGAVEISAGGSISTSAEMQNFYMILELKPTLSGDIKISFGGQGSNAVIFKSGTHNLVLENLKDKAGKTTLSLNSTNIAGDERDINIFTEENPVTVRLQVMGEKVTLYAMKHDEPVEKLSVPVAEMVLSGGASAGNVTISTSQDGQAAVESMKLYSLMPQIAIETEHYVPPEEPEDEEKEAVKEPMTILGLSPFTFIVIVSIFVVLIAAGVFGVIVIKKKRGRAENEKAD